MSYSSSNNRVTVKVSLFGCLCVGLVSPCERDNKDYNYCSPV